MLMQHVANSYYKFSLQCAVMLKSVTSPAYGMGTIRLPRQTFVVLLKTI
jgi:hypothetical protein